jgi:DNA-binding NarL/FixJ family response regulator
MQSLGNEDRGNSAATMRVLVADQEPEMLEAIARVFEVDVATTKATCIDLLRANHFDVIVACERLGDGSGLELLSHVGQRWPHVIRILAIEPERRAMLRGRLGPFKLFETLSYPIDEQKFEAALERAAEQIAANEAAEARDAPSTPSERPAPSNPPTARPAPSTSRPAPVSVASNSGARTPDPARAPNSFGASTNPVRPTNSAAGPTSPARAAGGTAGNAGATRPAQATPPIDARQGNAARSTQNAPMNDARAPASRMVPTPSAPLPRNVPPPSRAVSAPQGASFAGKQKPAETGYPPLPSKGSKIVPLGSPAAGDYKILKHNYDQSMPGTLRGSRDDADQKKTSLPEKAASLAAEALSKVSRYIKPQSTDADDDGSPPPRKKR